eukprot:s5163_g2.t1
MPVLKRPAAAETSVMEPVMKKPAAKPAANAVKALRNDLEEFQKNEKKGDEGENEEGDGRNKLKSEKWSRMRAAGALPDYLVNLYEEESKFSPMGKRRFQTEIVNKLFKKGRGGQWELDTSDVQFQSHKALYEKKFNRDEKEALPKSLLLGMYFQGDETKFTKALDQGVIELVREENGVRFFAFRRITAGTDKGTQEKLTASGSRKGTKEQFEELGALFGKLKWTLKKSASDSKALDSGKLPASFDALVVKARTACDKLMKDTLKLEKDVPHDKKPVMKDGYKTMSKHLATLDHMKAFCEFPDGTAFRPQPSRTAWETWPSRWISSTPRWKSSRAT